MAEEGKGKIEKFNGMNFQWWRMQVEDYLYQKDLYLPLVGEKPEAMNASEWAILDRKALATNNKQNNRGRSPTRGRSRSRGKSKSKGKTIVCWNCNKEGHKKNDCTELKKKKGAGGRQSDDEGANMVSSNERTYDDLCLSATVDDNSKVWYVDSGASIHCTPYRDCFCDYVHGDYGHVTVGNGYRCSIVGKGKVKIKLSNGGTLVLKDVRHIPELQKNLISVSGLDREGYFVAFGEKQWKVIKGSMVVARENQKTTLWHHRLGHLSESGMKILHSKNALPGMKNIQLDFCEGCVYGKQKRVSFRRDGKEKKIERLELVHTDVCGPTTVKSLRDDASRKTWIYAIKQKSDVYHTFKKWKALVENETGNKVKCLKSDNGGEYRNGGFQEYCSNNGIRLIRTVKRTPQENDLAERMNRTIMERARCMRIHADLPLQFWAAAVDTAVYLINRSPASALHGGIPEEEWLGKPVNYSFLKVFGCIAYAHIDKEERKKLDSKSQKCVFIGYGGDEYGYCLWDYEHNKIIRSRDVIFDESRLYKHRLQEHGIEKENKEYMELDEPEDGQIRVSPGNSSYSPRNVDGTAVQSETVGMLRRLPTAVIHGSNVSANTQETGRSSSWSSNRQKGASILVNTDSMKPIMSAARSCSEGTTLGIDRSLMFGLSRSQPTKPSHSSVRTMVMVMLSLEARWVQRLIMGLMWPRPGYGMATMWQPVACLWPPGCMVGVQDGTAG
ncbi:hypothetical protein RJ639_013759 [Escallonia herrerae]|uniref:Retrovirus-related Pol polyprotein from transposon TNT 1-94 n=1 Tax=Escallonia herrerae TaxID=1293975 RepID=A0AA88VQA5_9ASTE|nr:hypothetical protein RJ639_013759 [Escallonia herrerae]